jgi:outer membrane protein TolC
MKKDPKKRNAMARFRRAACFLTLALSLFSAPAMAADVLSWEECVKEAARNHPDLISAEEAVKEKEAAKKATASGLYPQVTASVDASTSMTDSAGGERTTDAYAYGVSGTQLIFDGFKTSKNVSAAAENVKAIQQNYRFVSSEVRLRLRNAFIDLLKSQEFLRLAEEIRKIRRDNLVLISLRYESGIEHKGALLNAQAEVAQATFEIMQAKRLLEFAQKELTKEMGRRQFSPVRAEMVLQVADPVSEKPDFEKLAVYHPTLGRMNAQKNSAAFRLQSARAAYLPEVSARANAGKGSTHFPPEYTQWDLGLGVSYPLFEGGLRSAQVAEAMAVLHQAQEDERSTKDTLVVALEQMWVTFQAAQEAVSVKKSFLEAAEERAKIAGAQYSLGLIRFDDCTII